MANLRAVAVLAALVGGGIAFARRAHGRVHGDETPGGILMPNPGLYDRASRWLFGSLFGPIAADVAAMAVPGATVLEVGCGPGHLSTRLAAQHGLEVTGIDLDPAMIERARANAARSIPAERPVPELLVADVAALPFPDASFHLVVSTFSMHHWADPVAGLAEIDRVLRPDGRALVWDLRQGFSLFHFRSPDPTAPVLASPLELIDDRPWRWPARLSIARRLELKRGSPAVPDESPRRA
jgi:SAM-dependent methyltransferase